MAHILVYGSLRKGGLNFNRCGNQTFVKAFRLQGFNMHSYHDAYPTVCQGNGMIIAELHKVSKKTLSFLAGMEHRAGYTAFTVKVEGVDAVIFMMDEKVVQGLKRVDSGDWFAYQPTF